MTENRKNPNDEISKDYSEQSNEQDLNGSCEANPTSEDEMTGGGCSDSSEISILKQALSNKEKECEEYLDLARRTKAEFDNFRKRTQKEKDALYDDGFSEAIKNLLPILDNLERAVSFNTQDKNSFSEGVDMVLKIFKDTLNKLGVEEIEAVGQKFDPDFHNAVMHIEDESLEENVVVEALQKGYKYKNKVIRHSMVKVAN